MTAPCGIDGPALPFDSSEARLAICSSCIAFITHRPPETGLDQDPEKCGAVFRPEIPERDGTSV